HQAPHERVSHNLEGNGGQRLVVVRVTLDHRLFVVQRVRLHGRHVSGRGKEGDHSVQQRLHSLVLQGGATEDGRNLVANGGATDGRDQLLLGERLALQV